MTDTATKPIIVTRVSYESHVVDDGDLVNPGWATDECLIYPACADLAKVNKILTRHSHSQNGVDRIRNVKVEIEFTLVKRHWHTVLIDHNAEWCAESVMATTY